MVMQPISVDRAIELAERQGLKAGLVSGPFCWASRGASPSFARHGTAVISRIEGIIRAHVAIWRGLPLGPTGASSVGGGCA